MKLKAHSVAFTLQNRFMPRGLDDEHAQNPRRQPATNDVTPVRIIEPGNVREMPEDGPDDRDYQLNVTGRYAPSMAYLARMAKHDAFDVLHTANIQVRVDRGKPR